MNLPPPANERLIHITTSAAVLEGNLVIPAQAGGIVLFAHGSGSSRHSPRNRFVARLLQQAGFATLLIDLLTSDEDEADRLTAHLRFDIGLLTERLVGATDWLAQEAATQALPLGYFGASTGAAAALCAAAQRSQRVAAVVSRGGRPDLAGAALRSVRAPTLLIVGGNDTMVIAIIIVPGAGHLFEEPGALDMVAQDAAAWFRTHLMGCAAATRIE